MTGRLSWYCIKQERSITLSTKSKSKLPKFCRVGRSVRRTSVASMFDLCTTVCFQVQDMSADQGDSLAWPGTSNYNAAFPSWQRIRKVKIHGEIFHRGQAQASLCKSLEAWSTHTESLLAKISPETQQVQCRSSTLEQHTRTTAIATTATMRLSIIHWSPARPLQFCIPLKKIDHVNLTCSDP